VLNETPEGRLNQHERIYILVSSSVPLSTLRSYMSALDKLADPRASMVMRGFVGGMKYLKPTIEFVAKVRSVEPDCNPATGRCKMFKGVFNIDPLIFRRYGVTQVPAVIYVPSLSVVNPGLSEGITAAARVEGPYYVSHGDARLEYHLEKILEQTKSKSVEEMLSMLRKGFY
jgi:type-F conjugative transfer system pilin assembly protein TrbC